MRGSNVSVVCKCSLVKGVILETNLTTRARTRTRARRPLTPTEERKLLHRVERNLFIDRIRHDATKQGRFDKSCWHLDHPLPGTDVYLRPSDQGAGADRVYAALEKEPLWLRLWRRAVTKLPPRGRAVLAALEIDWRTAPAAKIAGVSRPTVDSWKTKLKTHFAQCWRAYERDFAK